MAPGARIGDALGSNRDLCRGGPECGDGLGSGVARIIVLKCSQRAVMGARVEATKEIRGTASRSRAPGVKLRLSARLQRVPDWAGNSPGRMFL